MKKIIIGVLLLINPVVAQAGVAQLTSHVDGQTVYGTDITLQFASGCEQQGLFAGTSFSGSDLLWINYTTTNVDYVLNNLPADGSTVYFDFRCQVGGVFEYPYLNFSLISEAGTPPPPPPTVDCNLTPLDASCVWTQTEIEVLLTDTLLTLSVFIKDWFPYLLGLFAFTVFLSGFRSGKV